MWKIDMPPLIAKIRHDTFVKMKNCGYCICRKLSQLEHIKIWKENWSIFTEIQSIFQKYADVIICKLKFWVWRPLWWRHELIEDQMRHEIISPTHNLSKYEKILGVSIYSKELQWILYRHVFAHVLWIKITQIRACCQLWRTLIALLKGEQVIKMLGKMCQIWWQRKFGDSMLQNASTRENARACACA